MSITERKTVTDQTAKRNNKGQFAKGNKPKNGFNKNPQNIASGGYWRYKTHGKFAIMEIFKMSVAEFYKCKDMPDEERTVLDEVLYKKFQLAMAGNSRDFDYLFDQAFGDAPRYREAKEDHTQTFSNDSNPFKALSREELKQLLNIKPLKKTE
jgi:hypothetical protein